MPKYNYNCKMTVQRGHLTYNYIIYKKLCLTESSCCYRMLILYFNFLHYSVLGGILHRTVEKCTKNRGERERRNDMQQRAIGWNQTGATAVRTQPLYMGHLLYGQGTPKLFCLKIHFSNRIFFLLHQKNLLAQHQCA